MKRIVFGSMLSFFTFLMFYSWFLIGGDTDVTTDGAVLLFWFGIGLIIWGIVGRRRARNKRQEVK